MLFKIITKNTYPKMIENKIIPVAHPQQATIENNMCHLILHWFFEFFDDTALRTPATHIKAPLIIPRSHDKGTLPLIKSPHNNRVNPK